MANKKIGILRETKSPPDRRVPLTPSQIVKLQCKYPDVEFVVQPSEIRCYSDSEYEYLDIPLQEDLSDCDVLLGVKEIKKETFIEGKKYMFFAHVAKKQEHNRAMFQEAARKKISLIDYEYLTRDDTKRIVAFGRWAGIAGAYKGLRARGIRTDRFNLKSAHECHDLDEMWAGLKKINLKPGLKILITGEGRVAGGAMESLGQIDQLRKVSPEEFLTLNFDEPVVCQIGPGFYAKRKNGGTFNFQHFKIEPEAYETDFLRFTRVTDVLIACHYWDTKSPRFFTLNDMRSKDFRISVIADVSCDINGAIPSTIRPTTIEDSFYGFNPETGKEETAFTRSGNVTVMAVDNLPGELPRDSSSDFGNQLIENVIDHLINNSNNQVISRATILRNGELTERYSYMKDYLEEES